MSTPSKSTPSKSTPSKSTPSKSTPSKSTPSKSTPSKSTPSKSTPGKENKRHGPGQSPGVKPSPFKSMPGPKSAKKRKIVKALVPQFATKRGPDLPIPHHLRRDGDDQPYLVFGSGNVASMPLKFRTDALSNAQIGVEMVSNPLQHQSILRLCPAEMKERCKSLQQENKDDTAIINTKTHAHGRLQMSMQEQERKVTKYTEEKRLAEVNLNRALSEKRSLQAALDNITSVINTVNLRMWGQGVQYDLMQGMLTKNPSYQPLANDTDFSMTRGFLRLNSWEDIDKNSRDNLCWAMHMIRHLGFEQSAAFQALWKHGKASFKRRNGLVPTMQTGHDNPGVVKHRMSDYLNIRHGLYPSDSEESEEISDSDVEMTDAAGEGEESGEEGSADGDAADGGSADGGDADGGDASVASMTEEELEAELARNAEVKAELERRRAAKERENQQGA